MKNPALLAAVLILGAVAWILFGGEPVPDLTTTFDDQTTVEDPETDEISGSSTVV